MLGRRTIRPYGRRPDPATLRHVRQVRLWPLYRDPVHDFGFFRFDPADIKFMELHAIALRPDAASVRAARRQCGAARLRRGSHDLGIWTAPR
jgi:hypothetical protein